MKRLNLAAAVEVSAENMFVLSGTKRAFGDYRGYGEVIELFFLPLSFYAKKKAAERKARIRGGGAEDARVREHMVAPIPPLMYLPLTAQPISKLQIYTRNGRRARRLPFLRL